MINLLKSAELEKLRDEKMVTVNWKQGSFLGFGGDRSQKYQLMMFQIKGTKGEIVVFVQHDFVHRFQGTVKIDSSWQYGLNNGDIFFVVHDKEQTIYQHRFVQSETQKIFYTANKTLTSALAALAAGAGLGAKSTLSTFELGWVVGDYLHDVE